MTLAQFCEALSARPADELVAECDQLQGITIRFALATSHDAGSISQFASFTVALPTLTAAADVLDGCQSVSLGGSGSLKAKDLEEALRRYLPKHAEAAVCHKGSRVVSPIVKPPTKSIVCKDDVLFENTDMAERGRESADKAMRKARKWGTNPKMSDQNLVDTVEAFMPALWVLALFRVGTRVLTADDMGKRFPRLTATMLPRVFKPVGHNVVQPEDYTALCRMPTLHEGGKFLLYSTSVDYDTLVDTFGPKVSKIDRLLKMLDVSDAAKATAAAESTTTTSDDDDGKTPSA